MSLAQVFMLSCTLMTQQAPALPAPPQLQQGGWKDPAFIRELQLSQAQVGQIEQVFQAAQRDLAPLYAEQRRSNAVLQNLMQADPIDEARILKQIELLAESRAVSLKAELLVHLSLRKVCGYEQTTKLLTQIMPAIMAPAMPVATGIRQPKAIYQPMPPYTDEARANRIEGTIVLQLIVHRDGTAAVSKVLKGLGYGLDQNAIETIERRWRFEPGTLYGQPMEVQAVVEVRYRLH